MDNIGAAGGSQNGSLQEPEPFSLPGTPGDVALLLKDEYTSEEVSATIRKYSGSAFSTGRPLDSLQIILAGYSGSGKSSTINILFDDPALCQISSLKSETRDPVMVQKRLICNQTKGPPVEGTLSLVDLPGNFDTDNRREVCNLASIRKFMDSMYASREDVSISCLETPIRKTVYPNLVLFTLKATDNRLEGNNTNLRKALILLQKIGNLVDPQHPNLIILVTHVCSLGLHATYFNEDLNEKKNVIRDVVKEVLGISDIDIIPIENRPERYQLEKSGDYYKLPNDELSHYNLYQAMLKRLERNNDNIGQLFANWYFQSTCPEKQNSAETVLPTIDVDYSDLAKAATELHILQKGTNPMNPVIVFKFDMLGFGYCPATEKLKLNIIPRKESENVRNMKQVEIRGGKFMIPKYVSEAISESSQFRRLTFLEKGEYQEHMKKAYGIDESFKLNMITGSDSKWMNEPFDRRGIRKISFSQDVEVCTFRLVLPEKILKESIFYKELTSLPTEYSNEETAKKFLAFFAKWGTHLIHEVKIGGCFQLNCTVKAGVGKDKVKEVEDSVQGIFGKLFGHSSKISLPLIYNQVANLRTVGVIQESLEVHGGDDSENLEWENATLHDVEEWRKSIYEKPTELVKSVKLIPYYDLLKNKESPLYNSLFQATKRYMEEPGSSCFPRGTQVYLMSGESVAIEKLSSCGEKLKTVKTLGNSATYMKIGSVKGTPFCAFLDKKPLDLINYVVLNFSNGRKLIASPEHMIFQYLTEDSNVVAKRARSFAVGEMAVYMGLDGSMEYPVIENVSNERAVGAYSPLTMSGTFFANGFLVTSYASVDSFTLADGALLPLKIWSRIRNLRERGKGKHQQLTDTENENVGIHPYAKFLVSIKSVYPM